MIKRWALWPILFALLLPVALACRAADDSPETSATATPVTRPAVMIAGSTAMYPVIEALVDAYASAQPDASIWLETTHWRDGLAAVREDKADIGLWAGEPIPTSTISVSLPIALDPIAVIVHPSNPLQDLSLETLRLAYAGRIFTWDEIDGTAGLDLQPVSRAPDMDTTAIFEATIMRGTTMTLQTILVPSSEAMVDYVSTHEGAVGYVSLAWVDERVKVVAVQGVDPTTETVRSGQYALVRPLWLLANQDVSETAKAFMAYCLSPAGQAIVASFHVPVQ